MRFCIPVWFLLMILPVFSGCEDEEDPITAQPPVFTVTPVDISGPYDPTDSTFGDIKFIEPVILPFGGILDEHRLSPAIEYYTDTLAVVRAVNEGIVAAVVENPFEEGDFEIHVTAMPGSDYTIIYDHVLIVRVTESQMVYPGDTLGKAGTWNENMRRTSLRVSLGEGTDRRSYCPLNYGDSAFVARHKKLLQEYNARDFSPVYDTLCLKATVTP